MAIGKKGRICTITYPNGNQFTSSLAIYTGTVESNGYILKANADSAISRGECFTFDFYPEIDSSQSTATWHEWRFQFSGNINGIPLPAFGVQMRSFITSGRVQTDVHINGCSIGSTTLIPSPTASGGAIRESGGVQLKWYMMISYRAGEIYIYIGLRESSTQGLYLTYMPKATPYFNATTEVEFGYPYGPSDNPDKYTSVEQGGQNATMKDTSDPIDIDTLPSAVVGGGLFRIYEMSNVQLTNLSNILVDPSIIQQIVRTVTSPMDYIIALKAMPVDFPSYAAELRIGNYEVSMSSGNPQRLSTYMTDIDCGEVAIPLYFDTFLDWSPYTSATLYLPFIGYVNLNIDKFVNDKVKIKYRIDCVSGDCVAFVSNTSGLIATYSGNCAYNLPLRANDSSQMVGGLYSALAGLVTGNAGQFASGSIQLTSGVYKPNMVTTSGLSANAGSMCNRKPYLIIERPVISLPKTYGHDKGYMSRISAKLSTLKGYTQVEDIHLDNVNATAEEKAELERLLKQGVIF